MNFKEWASQTAKLLPVRYNKEIVEEVLYAAIKAAIEEFMTNPAEADLAIMGVGRFYMNRSKRNSVPVAYREKSVAEVKLKWQVIFRPSRMFKELLNGLKEAKDYRIVNRYLFPEYHYGETTQFGLVVKPTKSLEIMHSNDYWIKRIQGIVDGKLELKSDGSIGKKTVKKWQPPETRGRKRKRLTPAQVRTEVMTLMRRDLRRELRHYRQGKITEEDFVYARFGCKKELSEIRREKKKAENKIIREKREKELAKEKAKERKLAQIEKEKAQKQAHRELEKEKAQKKALREKERQLPRPTANALEVGACNCPVV